METLEQPVAALELSSLSEDVRFIPGRISHFRAVISDLYMAIYESTMVRSATGSNQNPIEPVFDPNALGGNSVWAYQGMAQGLEKLLRTRHQQVGRLATPEQ